MAVTKRLADEVGEAIRVRLMKDFVCIRRSLGLFLSVIGSQQRIVWKLCFGKVEDCSQQQCSR